MRSPWGRTVWWAAGAGRGPGLTVIVVEGSHVPGSVWPAAVVVCGGWMTGRMGMGMLTRVSTGSCRVAASVVAAPAGGRGAWVVVGGCSWLWLGFGLGRCHVGWRRGVCGVVGCVTWCWWWCCCWWCAPLGAGLGLRLGFGLGSGSRLRRTSVRRCEGAPAGWGGFPVCCWGAWVACVGVGGTQVAWRAAAALAFAVALWMRSSERGGSEEKVEDVDEAEDEEEMVVFGDAGCAVMRAVAGLSAAASAAATAGRMEGMSSGCRLGVGDLGGRAVIWRPDGPIWSAAVVEGGAGLRSSPSGLGWAGVLQCVRLCGLASAEGNSSCGPHLGAGGGWPGLSRVCAVGVCGPLGGVGVPWGVGLPFVGVCGLLSVGGGEGCPAGGSVAGVCCCLAGWGRPVSQGSGVHPMVGVCGSPAGQRGRRGMGGDCAEGDVVSVYVSVSSGVLVWPVVGRAVWRKSLPSSASGQGFRRRACVFGAPLGQCWEEGLLALSYIPRGEDPVDGVVPAGEGVLWSGGGGPSACLSLPRFVCGRLRWP